MPLFESLEEQSRKISFLGTAPQIDILRNDLGAARKRLEQIESILSGRVFACPYQLSPYYVSKFMYQIRQMQNAVTSGTRGDIGTCRRQAATVGKRLLKNARKVASAQPETYRLMGRYYWLVNRRGRALNWWHKSIQAGQRLGARPDLARTYLDVGRHLALANAGNPQLNGIGPDQYLAKARALFRSLDLGWDLKEMKQVTGFQKDLT